MASDVVRRDRRRAAKPRAAEPERIYQLRRKKLVGIYEKHNPSKLKDVDALVKAYAGRESAL